MLCEEEDKTMPFSDFGMYDNIDFDTSSEEVDEIMPFPSKDWSFPDFPLDLKIYGTIRDADKEDLSNWDNNKESEQHASEGPIINLIPTIEEEDEIIFFSLGCFPPSISPLHNLIPTIEEEDEIMTHILRCHILEASPHSRIRRQVGIVEIVKRNQHLSCFKILFDQQDYHAM
jgi:hypothetical protein